MDDQTPTPGEPRTETEPAKIRRQPEFNGTLGKLFRIFLKNLLLTILTIGFYRFWGKTNMRRYVWSHMTLGGEPFEYSGTGKELFIGFLKAAAVLVPFFVVVGVLTFIANTMHPVSGWIVETAQYLILLILTYVGSYAALRYRLRRTHWHGIRFNQAGSPWVYGRRALGGTLLLIISFGFYAPFMSVNLRRYQFEHLSYGTLPFAFDGDGQDLFKYYALAWVLSVPTLGLSMIWYGARAMSYYAAHTRIGGVRLAMPITFGQYFSLVVGNLFIVLLSIGLLLPIALKRTLSFWCAHLTLEGSLDMATIRQLVGANAQSGEGLAGFFDIDTGFG